MLDYKFMMGFVQQEILTKLLVLVPRLLIQAVTLPFPVLKSCHGFSYCFYGLARVRPADSEKPSR